MPIQLILGRAGSGKTRWVLESVRHRLRMEPEPLGGGPTSSPLVVLVPEQATFQTEYALISDAGLVGSVRAQVLSFRRLAWRILQEAGGAARPPIGELGKHMLLRALLARLEGELRLFGRTARQAGFIQRLARTLAEFEAYNISPQDLWPKPHPNPDPAQEQPLPVGTHRLMAEKLHDLALVYEAYRQHLEGRYTDPDGYLRLATQKLKEVGWMVRAEVLVDGFSDFTPQEYILLEGLIQTCQQVYITLGLDPDAYDQGRVRPPREGEPFFITRETLYQLWVRAQGLKVKWLDPIRLPAGAAETGPRMPRFKDRRLAHLEAEFFEHPGQPYQGYEGSRCTPNPAGAWQASADNQPGCCLLLGQLVPKPNQVTQGIEIRACMNRQAEVEAGAEYLVHLVRSQGYRWRELLVLASDLEIYHDLIATTFSDYGIPYFIDRKRPVSHHPLVELVEGLLDLVINHWDYESVFRILKTDFLPISRQQVDRLENYVLAYGIRGSLWYSPQPWRFHSGLILAEDQELEPGGEADQESQPINQIRQQVLDVLLPWYRQISQALSASREAGSSRGGRAQGRMLTELLFAYLEKLGVPQTLHRWQEQARAAGDLTAAQVHNLVWNGLVDIGDQLVEALGPESLSLAEYRDILATGLESLRLGLIPPSLDQVLVGSVERSRNPEAKAVLILGANEGMLPRTPMEDEVLNDKEREELARLGLELAPPSQQAVLRQQYLAYTALTRASQLLCLSYSLADEEGRALNPSLVVRKLKRLFPGLSEQYVGLERSLGTTARQAAAFLVAHWSQVRAQMASGDGGSQQLMALVVLRQWLEANPSRRREAAPVLTSLNYNNQEPALPPALVQELYRLTSHRTLRSSVSRLEQLAACPFAHFAAYGLGLKERRLFKLDPPSMGSFFHAALRTLVERLPQGGRSWAQLTREEEETLAGQVADELVPKLQNEILLSTARYRYLAEILKRTVVRAAMVLGDQARRGGFWPVAVELPFGMGRRGEQGQGELSLPAYEVDLGGGYRLWVRGIIDRVDLAWRPEPDPNAAQGTQGAQGNPSSDLAGTWYVRVIDYKSSKPSWRLDETYHGLTLQLLLYLAVASSQAQLLVGGQGTGARTEAGSQQPAAIVPAGMFYFTVGDPLVSRSGPVDPSQAEQAVRSELGLRGLVLGDPVVAGLLDREVGLVSPEQFIKALRQRGLLGRETVAVSNKQMQVLLAFLNLRLRDLGRRLLAGEVGIYPYRQGNNHACRFCLYRPACQFERGIGGNRYHVLAAVDPDQLWPHLEAEVASHGLD